MRILVVEDDALIAHAVTNVLTSQTYAVEVATDGQTGWELIEAFDYDLLLLDVMLPRLDGISLCRQVRSKGLQMPILLLTGRDGSHDKAIGLDAGADDYVVKPFDAEELVARVRALLRRGRTIAQPVLEWGELQLDPSSCEVTYANTPLVLTPKEYALLELFLRNSRRVFSCGMILEHLWSYEKTPGEDAVRTHIKGLRQKFKAAGMRHDVIETVYGIGYRLKPRDGEGGHQARETAKWPSQPAAASSTQSSLPLPSDPESPRESRQQTLALISQVWHRFKERVSEQVGVLERAAIAMEQQPLEQTLRQQAGQEAHTLAGSLGTFGLPEGSRLARQIEQALRSQVPLDRADVADLQAWVVALRRGIEQHNAALENSQTLEGGSPSSLGEDDRPLLLIVDHDRAWAEQLVMAASEGGLRTDVATNLTKARAKIFLESPDVVLLDAAISATTTASFALMAELGKMVPPIPVVLLLPPSGGLHPSEIPPLGRCTALLQPVPPSQILETVNQVLHQADRAKASVMVVDDDPKLLAIVRSLLEPWGLKVTTLANPQQFWEVLAATVPDLLILDIEMPEIRGIELCQQVRNDVRWGGLPILFLTVHIDSDTVNQVFSVGADDFVCKPIVGPELVTRIINRLERTQFLRGLAETDALTQVATRQKSTQDLTTFLRLAQRQKQPLCLAVLDLDQFKQVNQRYGHAIGDEVLHQIGQLLRRSFRTEDVVARWGGEEFVIGMYGTHKQDGVQRLGQVLATLRQMSFTGLPSVNNDSNLLQDLQHLRVTFRAGVAEYPEDGHDLHTLYQAADAALYQAKLSGFICVA